MRVWLGWVALLVACAPTAMREDGGFDAGPADSGVADSGVITTGCVPECAPAWVCEVGACVSRVLALRWAEPGDGALVESGPGRLRLLLAPFPGRAQNDPPTLDAVLLAPDGGSAALTLAHDDGGYSALADLTPGAWRATAEWGPLTATQAFLVRDAGLDAGLPDAGARDAGPCTQDWCLVHPLPTAEDLKGLSGTSANDVWAVGSSGAVLHYDGAGWTRVSSVPGWYYTAVWCAAPNDVWAVALGGAVVHYDGSTWTSDVSGGQSWWGVWGSSSSDVWLMGNGAVVRHWDGTQWTYVYTGAEPNAVLRSAWGTGPADVWVAGAAAMRHWDGTAWTGVAAPGASFLRSVWGRAADDVWAVGSFGTIDHWDGTAWQSVPSGTTETLEAVGGDATHLWVAGWRLLLRWDGAAFQPVNSDRVYDDLLSIWQAGPSDAWIVGTSGALTHWDGASWTSVSGRGSSGLTALGSAGPGDLLAVGFGGNAVHWDGGAWNHVPMAAFDPDARVDDLWVLDQTHAWAVGGAGVIFAWDGTTWTQQPSGTTVWLRGVWGNSATDAWAVGERGTILHWDGGSWSPSPSGTTIGLQGVWSSGPTDAWAVGDQGLMLRWNGAQWIRQPTLTAPQANLHTVHGSGRNNVWVAGSLGSLMQWNGFSWAPFQVSAFEYFYSVRTLAPDDAWVVGTSGSVYRWDGRQLVLLPAPYNDVLRGLWVDADQTWVAGNNGRIYVMRR